LMDNWWHENTSKTGLEENFLSTEYCRA